MIDLVSLEARVAPIITELIESPAVQEDVKAITGVITEHILEIVADEIQKVSQSDSGLSRLWRLAIKKVKELFSMSDVTTSTLQSIEALAVTAVTGSLEDKKAALIDHFNAEIAATSSPWVKARDQIYIILINSADAALINYLMALVVHSA